MIKKLIFSFVVIILMFSVSSTAYAMGAGDVSAECAVLISSQTGEIIYEKNSSKRHSMASTTKIMTSLIAVESGRLGNEIKVTDSMLKVEGTSMGLMPGDSVSLEELVYGMLLPSGNDAANVTAFYLGGTVESFADMMNARAKEIGMTGTNFVTPSGLDSKEHYSTAYDMALLGRTAVSNPKFLSICSAKKATLTYGNPPYPRTLYNHNKLLGSYDYALGIKTGFTKKSGRCLVSYAEKGNVGLVAVTLNDRDDWADHKKMLDYGFDSISVTKLESRKPEYIAVVGGNTQEVKISSDSYDFGFVNEGKITQKTYLPKFIYAPVKSGQSVGYTEFYRDGEKIATVNIYTDSDVKQKIIPATQKEEQKGFLSKIKEFFQ